MNCKTCTYWEKRTAHIGHCDQSDTIPGIKLYNAGHGMQIEAYALDDSGLEARLLTGAQFGCNAYKARKP